MHLPSELSHSGKTLQPIRSVQPFIPRKAPRIFRWFSNEAWNPRDWITKRLNLRPKVGYWEDPELMAKVKSFADPRIQIRRKQSQKAKDLQDELSALFNEDVRSTKESHILIWMICLYLHSELEKNSTVESCAIYILRRRCHLSSASYIILQMIWVTSQL